MHPDTQIFWYMFTTNTSLGRTGRRNLYKYLAKFFGFVLDIFDKDSPSCIGNTLCEAMILNHVFDLQILNRNKVILLDDVVGCSVQEVLALISDFGMILDYFGFGLPSVF